MLKPIETALTKIPNRFLLTTVVARRWESLVAGSPPLVDAAPGTSKVDVVFDEILDDRIEVDHEQQLILTVGHPEAEESEEALFSEAFNPDSDNVKDIVGSTEGE